MFKIYKRTLQIGQTGKGRRLESSLYENHAVTGNSKFSNWLTVPAAVAGVVVGTLVFSVFFAVILIPLGILGLRVWLRLQKLKDGSGAQAIDAEYTVINEAGKTGKPSD